MAGELALTILQSMLLRAPSLVIGTVGLWFALSRRSLHPRVSTYAIVGFSCLLLNTVSFLVLQAWIHYFAATSGGRDVAATVVKWNVASYPINLIFLTAIAAAVFVDRKPTKGLVRDV